MFSSFRASVLTFNITFTKTTVSEMHLILSQVNGSFLTTSNGPLNWSPLLCQKSLIASKMQRWSLAHTIQTQLVTYQFIQFALSVLMHSARSIFTLSDRLSCPRLSIFDKAEYLEDFGSERAFTSMARSFIRSSSGSSLLEPSRLIAHLTIFPVFEHCVGLLPIYPMIYGPRERCSHHARFVLF